MLRYLTAAVTFFAMILGSCTSMPHYGRVTTGGGYSTTKASNEDDSMRLNGGHVGVRAEVATPSSVSEDLHMGLRVEARGRDVSADGLGDSGLGRGDMEVGELSLAIVARQYVPVSESFRPFLEGTVGYAHDFADMTAESPDTFGSFAMRDDKGGLLFGAGLGAEIGSQNNHAILQIDWSRRLIEDGEFDFDVDDVSLFVGWGFSF